MVLECYGCIEFEDYLGSVSLTELQRINGNQMPNAKYVQTMAKYNHWQNESLIQAADGLNEEERQLDRGAFFGSIQQTFSHILWGDQSWISRFTKTDAPSGNIPDSVNHFSDWQTFKNERLRFDQVILDWAQNINPEWFDGDLTWHSGAKGRDISKPKNMLVIHFFNHQTHHRGQIHALLTATGAMPDDTDLPFMPNRY